MFEKHVLVRSTMFEKHIQCLKITHDIKYDVQHSGSRAVRILVSRGAGRRLGPGYNLPGHGCTCTW